MTRLNAPTDRTVPGPGSPGDGLVRRLVKFVLVLGLALGLVYGLLPWLTQGFSITSRMARSLDETGIDPSRYYYTDVEQVLESELYLRTVLKEK